MHFIIFININTAPSKYCLIGHKQFLNLVHLAEFKHKERQAFNERQKIRVNLPGGGRKLSLFRNQQHKFSHLQSFEGDKGYQGGKNISTPHKKPRNRELTDEQKAENKAFSSNRIFVEHLIRLLKIFRIASVRFRLRSNIYEQIILTVCGLVRLRIGSLVLPTLS